MESIEASIHYQFSNPHLLAEALTHPSLAYEAKRGHFDNQRLEYLGDAVIQLILTDELFGRFPEFSEGRLTKLRSRLVSREALCHFAKEIQLGQYLLLGKGESANKGRERPSNLADAFEALTGAIYLDGGFEAARSFIFTNFHPLIEIIVSQAEDNNPKGELQEYLQAITPSSPSYRVIATDGPDHLRSFTVEVKWEGLLLGTGSGLSKKEAEINAATEALREKRWEQSIPSLINPACSPKNTL